MCKAMSPSSASKLIESSIIRFDSIYATTKNNMMSNSDTAHWIDGIYVYWQ